MPPKFKKIVHASNKTEGKKYLCSCRVVFDTRRMLVQYNGHSLFSFLFHVPLLNRVERQALACICEGCVLMRNKDEKSIYGSNSMM